MKNKTEELLCISFMELLKKNSFNKITIQMIATECGVNRQTFYYHFDNIYDLMSKAIEYELIYVCDLKNANNWNEIFTKMLRWMKMNYMIIKNILTHVDVNYFRRSIYQVIEKCLIKKSWSKNNMNLRVGIDDEKIVRFLTLAMTQYLVEWAGSDFKEPIEDIVIHFLYILDQIYDE